jgi:CheY-like chemotaxis protein
MEPTILIVDDSGMIRRIVGLILKSFGYKTLQAENGQVGYEQTLMHKPDLVIMDVEMPVMNGIESTRKIKSDPQTSHIPVVVLTSLGSEENIALAKAAGCDAFLNKPIWEEELRSTLDAILKRK